MPTWCSQPTPLVTARQLAGCVYGDPTAKRTIFIFGDSNAEMWFPAFDAFGFKQHWKLIAVTQASCQPWDTPWVSPATVQVATITAERCSKWRTTVLKAMALVHPYVAIPIGVGPFSHAVPYPTSTALVMEIRRLVRALKLQGVEPLLMEPIPRYPAPPPASSGSRRPPGPIECLVLHATNTRHCSIATVDVQRQMLHRAIARVATDEAVAEIQSAPLFCTKVSCPAYVASRGINHLVYRDSDHMTFTYSTYVSEALQPLLEPLLYIATKK